MSEPAVTPDRADRAQARADGPAPAPPGPTAARRAGPPPAAWACALTLAGGLGWVLLAVTHQDTRWATPFYLHDGETVLLGFAFALSGLLILAHRSGPEEHPRPGSVAPAPPVGRSLGRCLLAAGLGGCLSRFVLFAGAAADAGPVVEALGAALLLASVTLFIFISLALPLWLPEGRLPGGPGRLYVAAIAAWSALHACVVRLGSPLPYFDDVLVPDGRGLPLGEWRATLVAWGIVVTSLAVAAVRWRRSASPHRSVTAVLVPYLIWLITTNIALRMGSSESVAAVAYFAGSALWMLGAVGYAFTRDRSHYLDRATRRMFSVLALTALLIAGYLGIALLLRRLLPQASTADAQLLAAGALAIGGLLGPTTRWVVRAVDRFYYGDRARPYQVVRALAERLSRAVSPSDAPPLLCDTVVNALGLPGARVVLHTRTGPLELASVGVLGPNSQVFPLSYEGTVIGDLYAPPRAGQPELDAQDHEVLRFLADQAAPAIASLRLYEELQSGRRQIVLAREEERRRLRHDLHDGLGPTLSGLRLGVDTARAAVPQDSAAARSLGAVSAGIGQAIVELRRITEGLAPAALAGEGLAVALRRLVAELDGPRVRISLVLDPDPPPALPAAVEVAVLRISGEALNNVLRHSGAAKARLTLRVRPDLVVVEAWDDGCGFPEARAAGGGGAGYRPSGSGVGLRSMAERAEELGGGFTAVNHDGGALVRAALPRTPEADDA
ncbi:histidine kinase [Streptomyces sp. BE20]|uniref:sensor histidine kinase n=1 Tax=Streptomyces sp. BE20 TaxID=3002525 RepID=UPI002E786660|nr:histidine kinase [Streptomyces sp. BE20]MEE1823645.1 histidine kinase [Streptomyces sp. BE20]